MQNLLMPAHMQCEQARLARDARFDGRFFTGVLSTGIYCRPVCPARPPHEHNVRYFQSAAAAEQHGLRPCLPAQGGDAVGVDVADFSWGRRFFNGHHFIPGGHNGHARAAPHRHIGLAKGRQKADVLRAQAASGGKERAAADAASIAITAGSIACR